jgi:hypothetical protein
VPKTRVTDLRKLRAAASATLAKARLDVTKELTLLDLESAAAVLGQARSVRDAILYLACQGEPVAELARRAGLSRQRAHQIVRARSRPPQPPRPGRRAPPPKLRVA